jgi:hypothetical protein
MENSYRLSFSVISKFSALYFRDMSENHITLKVKKSKKLNKIRNSTINIFLYLKENSKQ